MLKKSSLLTASPCILALACTIALGTQSALATKLTGAPLPYEREKKEFNESNSIVIPPSASRFQRRLDYREEEKLKKQEAADAEKKAEQAKLEALEAVKKAQAQQVENAKQYQQMAIDANNSAVTFGKQNRWMEAIVAHEKAVQYDPANKQFKINLSAARTAYGQQRLKGNDFAGAAHLFRQALAAATDNSMAARLLSEALRKQGIDPGSSDQRIELSDKLLAANDLIGASIELQQAMALENSARVNQKMGDLSLRFGQVTTAMSYYRQAIVKDSDYGPAHRQLGFLQMSKNDFTAAAASLRKAVICDSKDVAAGQALVELWRKQVAQNPLLAENHLGLAGAMQLTGDFNGAEAEYRRLEALDPRNPGLESGRASLARAYQHAKAEKHKMAAETLYGQGLRREALGEINQAVMIEPKNAKYQFFYGECLEAVGDYAAAYKAYMICVLIDPENNKEAAGRMKEVQKSLNMSGSQVSQMSGQIANQLVNQINPSQQHLQQQQLQQQQAQQQMQAQQQQQQFAAQPPGSFRIAQPDESTTRVPQQHMQQPIQSMQEPIQQQSTASGKSMFEGGQGQGFNPQAMNFRTHDESQQAQAALQQTQEQEQRQQQMRQQAAMQAQQQMRQQAAMQAQQQLQAQQQAQAAQPAQSANDALSQVSVLESQRDYQGAANLLKQLTEANVENPELHHRLAINLLNLGQVAEAIPEFRIASALKPTMKAYSDDLARAMQIHKRSLMSDKSDSSGSK
ncbi:MAG: tetratricopeptide repeat protein [Candidatus Melainabacteria bacterium]|nr:tetratricopeptide repeat protein [Candidatus Melainabacteria bacterium]